MTRSGQALARVTLVAALLVGGGRATAQVRVTTLAVSGGAELRGWDASIGQMARAGDMVGRRTDADAMVPGRVHERLSQFYKGVSVFGADVTRQTDAGLTVSLFGTLYLDIAISVEPRLSTSDAADVVARETGVVLGPSKLPELVVLPDGETYRLAYHATAYTAEAGVEYFIDASDGRIIHRLDAMRRQSAVGSGAGVLGDAKKLSVTSTTGAFQASDLLRPPAIITFDMKENLQRTLDFLNGIVSLTSADRASDTDNRWSDPVAVDAHAYAGYVYDYYFTRFNRRGLDDRNFRMLSLVHPVNRQTALSQSASVRGSFYTNAFYAGGGVMVYGEGLPTNVTLGGQRWNYLAGGLDVVAHELTHGVTDFTSRLIYQNESGALNEAFSDMMGTSVEFFYQTAGSGALRADYLIGEDVVTPGGIRSMENPAAHGDPDHYSKRYLGTADNGGVHTNAGIGIHAYYLAIEGGTNRTSGRSVQGVGPANREQIEKVMYRAFTQLMPSNATYAVARAATIQSARDLYGAGSAAERAVTQAWTAVGVD